MSTQCQKSLIHHYNFYGKNLSFQNKKNKKGMHNCINQACYQLGETLSFSGKTARDIR